MYNHNGLRPSLVLVAGLFLFVSCGDDSGTKTETVEVESQANLDRIRALEEENQQLRNDKAALTTAQDEAVAAALVGMSSSEEVAAAVARATEGQIPADELAGVLQSIFDEMLLIGENPPDTLPGLVPAIENALVKGSGERITPEQADDLVNTIMKTILGLIPPGIINQP